MKRSDVPSDSRNDEARQIAQRGIDSWSRNYTKDKLKQLSLTDLATDVAFEIRADLAERVEAAEAALAWIERNVGISVVARARAAVKP